jgi:hypothetical protein
MPLFLELLLIENSVYQTVSGHRPLGSVNSSPVPPTLHYKKHSSE